MRLFYILALVMFALPASAQEGTQKVRLGIVAGINGFEGAGLHLSDNRGRWGGELGMKLELPFSANATHWYMDAELKMTLLRWHDQSGGGGLYERYFHEFRRDAYYLKLPVHLGRMWRLGKRVSLLADAGPYVGLGLFGHTSRMEGGSFSDKCNTFDRSRRFEWGVGLKGGVELCRHYQVGIAYDYGISRAHGSDRNANFTLFVGYMF